MYGARPSLAARAELGRPRAHDRSLIRSIACSATAVSIHVAVAGALSLMPPRTHASHPSAAPSLAVLVPFEPAPAVSAPPPEPEPEPVVTPPPPRRRFAPPKVATETPADPPPRDEPPEAPSAPAAGAPSSAPVETPGITSTAGGLAVAAGAGAGGQGGTSRVLGTQRGTATEAAPAVDRRALLALYRRMLDDAIAKPPPVRGIREPLDVTVVVALTIDARGRLLRTRLNRSSGVPGIDEHALEFLASLQELPAPPEALAWKTGTVLYPIRVIVR